MSFLLLYIGEGGSFDRDLIKSFWSKCSGVCDIRENGMVGATLSATFTFHDDSSLVELKKDCETISLSGTGKASVEMAFRLQSVCSEPLHLVDENYSFDLAVRDFPSSTLLAKAIYSAIGY